MDECGNPLISVIIPAYNIEKYIGECLISIINQTYENLQIIVIDDGSIDNTRNICDKIAKTDKRIKIIHQSNQGVVSARINGIKIAAGEFVSFIDGDDWIEPETYSFMIENLVDSDLISIGVFREIKSGYSVEKMDEFPEGKYEGSSLDKIFSKLIYEEKSHSVQPLTPWLCNKLFKTDLIRNILLEEDTSLQYGEDSVILYQYLLQSNSLKICHKSLYHYRYRNDSAIHKVDIYALDKIAVTYRALESVIRKFDKKYCLLQQLQKWFVVGAVNAINERMGFSSHIHIPRYILDVDNLKDNKVILYAAGRVGQDYYRQLIDRKVTVLAWVDKNYRNFSKTEYMICPVDVIDKMEYDYVIVAVEKENFAISIKNDLVKRGIQLEKILWNKPIIIY